MAYALIVEICFEDECTRCVLAAERVDYLTRRGTWGGRKNKEPSVRASTLSLGDDRYRHQRESGLPSTQSAPLGHQILCCATIFVLSSAWRSGPRV